MKTYLLLFILLNYGFAHEYDSVDGWLHPPKGMTHIGNGHGEIAIDSQGLIYISVTSGDKSGIQVYDAKGDYLHNVPNAPNDFHGFLIRHEGDGEYIYGATLNEQSVVKMTLQGDIVLTIPANKIPDQYKKNNKGKLGLKLTSVAVAPNGDIYAADGYGLDYIHHFDKKGKYFNTFGGRKAPYNLSNCHKIFIDHRYTPARILCTNRAKRNLVHLSLSGEMIGVHAKNLRRPSAISFKGDEMAVAEIEGRISILNKQGDVISVVSLNDSKYKGNRWKPEEWKDGIVGSPHGITYDKQGNLLMTEYNKYGRVMRFDLAKTKE